MVKHLGVYHGQDVATLNSELHRHVVADTGFGTANECNLGSGTEEATSPEVHPLCRMAYSH